MKTSKNIEVSYNLVRYGDPFQKYVDYQATPDNPYGKRGSIFTYESPLGALSLGAVYAVLGGKNFVRRVEIARYFTLFHLIAGYLLIGVLILRKDLFALTVFTFTLFGATFTVSYATKPLPETYSILYQGLFIALGAHLMSRRIGPVKKSAAVALLAVLLAAGGKINYFLIAVPVILGFPFFDTELAGIKNKLKYFAIFLIASGVVVLGMLLVPGFSFYDALVFMVKGNKPIIDDSLWLTFIEGFDAFGDIVERTRDDFGRTAFDWGVAAICFLVARLIYAAIFRRRESTLWDRFAVMTTLFIVGHAVNYVVLRNLYIPHRYYVASLYIQFCLAITILLGDIRTILFADFPLKKWCLAPIARIIDSKILKRIPVLETRGALHAVTVLFVGLVFLAVYLGYMGETLSSRGWRTNILLALKTFGSRMLAIHIRAAMAILFDVMIKGMWVSFAAAGLVLFSIVIVKMSVTFRKRLAGLDRLFRRAGIGVVSLSLAFALSFHVTFWIFKNGRAFYDYAMSHNELVEHAQDLAKIRRDTESGALVLAWKVCMAFYADKRSITEATRKDLAYYREHHIASVMGPMDKLHRYYKRVEKYPPPMSYWVPRERKSAKRKAPKKKK